MAASGEVTFIIFSSEFWQDITPKNTNKIANFFIIYLLSNKTILKSDVKVTIPFSTTISLLEYAS